MSWSSPPQFSISGADDDSSRRARHVEVVRQYADEVWNQRRFDVCEELFRPGHVYHDPLVPMLGPGPEGVRQHHILYTQAFPDCHVIVEDLYAFADRALARWLFTGTHSGPIKGIEPTGRRVEITGIHLFRFSRGGVAETWVAADHLGMFQQMGVIPRIGPEPVRA
jgi:predicted ester cyclase